MQALIDPRVEVAVAAYFELISTRNKSAWFALFDKRAVLHEPVGATPGEGRDGLEEVWQVYTGPFSKLTLNMDEVFYSGSGAAVRWSANAVAVNGRAASFAGITVFEVDTEGLVQTVMSYWDPAEVLIRLAGDVD
jgi:ketosteroid isomerase-like protein